MLNQGYTFLRIWQIFTYGYIDRYQDPQIVYHCDNAIIMIIIIPLTIF